jgi:hypothetical protein
MQKVTDPLRAGSRFGRTASLAVVVAIAALTPVLAHHSFAGYDKSRKVTVTGTVRQWQFTNPHSWLQLMVVENGRQVEYPIEGSSVNTLIRRGWSRTTFRPGETVTVEIYPRTGGARGGALLMARFANGRTISSGITPN